MSAIQPGGLHRARLQRPDRSELGSSNAPELGCSRIVSLSDPPCRWIVLIAAATFGASQAAEGIDGGAEIGEGIKPGVCGTSDPPPGSCEADGTEQVCNDLDLVVALFVVFRSDPDESDLLWEQSQLHRFEIPFCRTTRVRCGILQMTRLQRGVSIVTCEKANFADLATMF